MDQRPEVISEGQVWKEILTPGKSRISQKPSECSTCLLKIENVSVESIDEASSAAELRAQHTTVLTGETEVTLIIGEADSEMDKRIEMAVKLMRDGEKSRITISFQDRATGHETRKVSFEATLLKHERFKPIWEWTPAEKYEIASRYNDRGIKLFKGVGFVGLRFRDAFHRFSRACKILITLEPIHDLDIEPQLLGEIETLRLKLYTNMAACQGKHNNHYHVIELCSKVLSRNDTNILALFRRGCAYGELRDYERAVQDLTKLASLEPNNKEAIMKLQQYESCLRRANVRCNEMVKRMFQ